MKFITTLKRKCRPSAKPKVKIIPDRSCRICGFIKPRESEDNIGYCLYFDDTIKPGESLKIPYGAEKELAAQCEHYFRYVDALTKGEFLQWRLNLEIAARQHRMKRMLDVIAVLAFGVEAIHLLVSLKAERIIGF